MTLRAYLNEFMRGYQAKIAQNASSSFELQILIRLDDVFGKISAAQS